MHAYLGVKFNMTMYYLYRSTNRTFLPNAAAPTFAGLLQTSFMPSRAERAPGSMCVQYSRDCNIYDCKAH